MKSYNNEEVKGITVRVIAKMIGNQEKVAGQFWYNKKNNEVVADNKTLVMDKIKKIIG